jgi:SOUL heme-binding protein
MKIVFIIIGVLVGLFIIFQIYISMATNKTETQAYKIIKAANEFEIRYYPSAIMAVIHTKKLGYDGVATNGFSKLANYIFGGNDASKKISMTAPVHVNMSDTGSSVGFVMPSIFNMQNLPIPNDTNVRINTSLPEYVIAISFGGFASSKLIKEQIIRLEAIVKQNKLSSYGNYRYLGYSPPYQLLGRRNEIAIAIDWNEKL